MTSVIGLNHKRDEIEQGHRQGVFKNYTENKTVLNQQANIQSLKKKTQNTKWLNHTAWKTTPATGS